MRPSTRNRTAGVSETAHPASPSRRNKPTTFRKTKADAVVEEVAKPHAINNNNDSYVLDGIVYDSYQEMVNAKRKRNQEMLASTGLLATVQAVQNERLLVKQARAEKRKKQKMESTTTLGERRKSNRLAGIESDGKYVEDDSAGRFSVASATSGGHEYTPRVSLEPTPEPEYYRGRINDGEALSIKEAVEKTGPKWVEDYSVEQAERLVRGILAPLLSTAEAPKSPNKVSTPSKTTMKMFQSQLDRLRVDDENLVAKVVTDRIYGIAAHPAKDKLIVSAGDKAGYVGIWNVDSENDSSTSLFKFHSGAASCLQWTPSGSSLFSASYDGTVRCLDVVSETFEQVFATYDEHSDFEKELGYQLDSGYRFWTQFAALDHRFPNDKCFFISTSVGTAMHIDLRAASGKGRITFHEELSEKKINTLSLHPNGHSLISGGLDCHVKLWDVRKLNDRRSHSGKSATQPLAFYNCGKSVNSAFFSPSGRYVVSTTMANKLDLFENAHQATSTQLQVAKSIRHDNMTGRWLTTFMANWHPELDIFVVGSMRKPRAIEVFDAHGSLLRAISGEAVTAVSSRCCFHASSDAVTIVGGNSSGRVTIVR